MTRRIAWIVFASALIGLAGCGPKYAPVTGVVTLDGKPVEGASVTFLSDDGKTTAFGNTDASGNFTLSTGEIAGAIAGNYKVVVVKAPKVVGGAEMSPGGDGVGMSKEYVKQMEKDMDKNKGTGPMMGKMGPGKMMPPGGGATAIKTELPQTYSTAEKTPLTAKIPSDGPIKIELKSKP